VTTGYTSAELKKWRDRASKWESGGTPAKGSSGSTRRSGRDVFIYMINGAKERAPAAALALLKNMNAD